MSIESAFRVLDQNFYGGIACPKCGGKDRFYYVENKRIFVCRKNPKHWLPLKDTLYRYTDMRHLVDKALAEVDVKSNTDDDLEKNNARLRAIFANSKPVLGNNGKIAIEYIVKRTGCTEKFARGLDIRFSPSQPYYEKSKLVGNYPAIINIIRRRGNLASMAITYLFRDGSYNKKIMPWVLGSSEAFSRTHTAERKEVVVGEGAEDVYKYSFDNKIPGFITHGRIGLEKFKPPSYVKKLTILADNDTSFSGQASAFILASKLADTCKVRVYLAGVGFIENMGVDYCEFNKGV